MVFSPDTHSCLELYFLRHGLAGQHGDPKYRDDSLRPLTRQGKEKMRRTALGMQKSGLKFETILSSPYLRARQTAEIVAQIFKIKNKSIHLTDNLLPPASIEELLKEIYSKRTQPPVLHKKIKNRKLSPFHALLVGHEPHLTELMSSLLKCHKPLTIDFKKGGLCNISISHGQVMLNWLLTPAQMGLMAG